MTTDANRSPDRGKHDGAGSTLWIRALASFLALPGIVAILVPIVLVATDSRRGNGWPAGSAVLAVGAVILLWCVRDFFVSGRGTLAPWDPPRHLVVVGLYRFMRNPMYVGVLTVVAGWSLVAGSPRVAIYDAMLAVGFHLRVILNEEPWLARTFGEEWRSYSAAVPRWIPRRAPWRG